ncbi:MAG: translation initiation factor IF-3 [bacterium]|nr:translation initiation factor IF-3 [bacterium]
MSNELRVNNQIQAAQIRLIDAKGRHIGVVPLKEGLRLAREAGLDLVEVNPGANPPVCKILDYGKFQYEKNKKDKEAKKKQKVIEVKEIRLRPEIGLHDLETKIRGAKEFLAEGNKVKFTIRLRGRQFLHTDRSISLANQIAEFLKDVAEIESEKPISDENREYTIVFSPKKQEEKKDGKRTKDTQRSGEEVQSNR